MYSTIDKMYVLDPIFYDLWCIVHDESCIYSTSASFAYMEYPSMSRPDLVLWM